MKTIKIYFGNGINELRTSCADSYTDLQKAIEDFIGEVAKIRKEFQTTEDHRKEYEVSDSYDYTQKETCHLELQKFDEDNNIEDWTESEFTEIKPETIIEFKKIVGDKLNGWMQTEDFMMKAY
jgi:hypothetical protein